MEEISIEQLLASFADDPQMQATVRDLFTSFAADLDTLDPALQTAIINCIRVLGVSVSLERTVAELHSVHGLDNHEFDYQSKRPLDIDAMELHAQLPPGWQRDPYWTKLCDALNLYNSLVGAISGLSHIACGNLWQCVEESLGGNWASTYLFAKLQPLVQQLAAEPGRTAEPVPSSMHQHSDIRSSVGHAFVQYAFEDVETELAKIARDRQHHTEWEASKPPALEVLDGGAAASATADSSSPELLRLVRGGTDDNVGDAVGDDMNRADTARLELVDAGLNGQDHSVDDSSEPADSETSATRLRSTIRRYQWAVGGLYVAAVAMLIVAGMVTHDAQVQVESAASRARLAEEKARELREAPIVVDVEYGSMAETWIFPG